MDNELIRVFSEELRETRNFLGGKRFLTRETVLDFDLSPLSLKNLF